MIRPVATFKQLKTDLDNVGAYMLAQPVSESGNSIFGDFSPVARGKDDCRLDVL